MTRWSLAALGVVALVAVGLLLWELQRGPTAPAGASPAAPAASDPPAAGRDATGSEALEPPAARRLRHVPTIDEVGHDRMQLLLAGDVPQRLMRAAATCYGGEPGQTEKLHLAYTLHFDQGRARVEDVELVSSDIGSPALERCVVSTLGELTWMDRAAPNLLRDMDIEISILDLRARRPRDDSADDAPNESDLDQ